MEGVKAKELKRYRQKVLVEMEEASEANSRRTISLI